jgi:hypothetical protein
LRSHHPIFTPKLSPQKKGGIKQDCFDLDALGEAPAEDSGEQKDSMAPLSEKFNLTYMLLHAPRISDKMPSPKAVVIQTHVPPCGDLRWNPSKSHKQRGQKNPQSRWVGSMKQTQTALLESPSLSAAQSDEVGLTEALDAMTDSICSSPRRASSPAASPPSHKKADSALAGHCHTKENKLHSVEPKNCQDEYGNCEDMCEGEFESAYQYFPQFHELHSSFPVRPSTGHPSKSLYSVPRAARALKEHHDNKSGTTKGRMSFSKTLTSSPRKSNVWDTQIPKSNHSEMLCDHAVAQAKGAAPEKQKKKFMTQTGRELLQEPRVHGGETLLARPLVRSASMKSVAARILAEAKGVSAASAASAPLHVGQAEEFSDAAHEGLHEQSRAADYTVLRTPETPTDIISPRSPGKLNWNILRGTCKPHKARRSAECGVAGLVEAHQELEAAEEREEEAQTYRGPSKSLSAAVIVTNPEKDRHTHANPQPRPLSHSENKEPKRISTGNASARSHDERIGFAFRSTKSSLVHSPNRDGLASTVHSGKPLKLRLKVKPLRKPLTDIDERMGHVFDVGGDVGGEGDEGGEEGDMYGASTPAPPAPAGDPLTGGRSSLGLTDAVSGRTATISQRSARASLHAEIHTQKPHVSEPRDAKSPAVLPYADKRAQKYRRTAGTEMNLSTTHIIHDNGHELRDEGDTGDGEKAVSREGNSSLSAEASASSSSSAATTVADKHHHVNGENGDYSCDSIHDIETTNHEDSNLHAGPEAVACAAPQLDTIVCSDKEEPSVDLSYDPHGNGTCNQQSSQASKMETEELPSSEASALMHEVNGADTQALGAVAGSMHKDGVSAYRAETTEDTLAPAGMVTLTLDTDAAVDECLWRQAQAQAQSQAQAQREEDEGGEGGDSGDEDAVQLHSPPNEPLAPPAIAIIATAEMEMATDALSVGPLLTDMQIDPFDTHVTTDTAMQTAEGGHATVVLGSAVAPQGEDGHQPHIASEETLCSKAVAADTAVSHKSPRSLRRVPSLITMDEYRTGDTVKLAPNRKVTVVSASPQSMITSRIPSVYGWKKRKMSAESRKHFYGSVGLASSRLPSRTADSSMIASEGMKSDGDASRSAAVVDMEAIPTRGSRKMAPAKAVTSPLLLREKLTQADPQADPQAGPVAGPEATAAACDDASEENEKEDTKASARALTIDVIVEDDSEDTSTYLTPQRSRASSSSSSGEAVLSIDVCSLGVE